MRIELAGSEGGVSRSRMSRGLRIELAELRRCLCIACVLICCASTSIFLKGGLYILERETSFLFLLLRLRKRETRRKRNMFFLFLEVSL